jgi:tetratricopeptide (TPR) repeat protein
VPDALVAIVRPCGRTTILVVRGAAVARIYLSSTYSDLKEHREKVYRVLRQLGHDVVAMEDYVAADQRPVDRCLADVAASDLYIGIFAHRYGYVPEQDNPDGRSITELEHRCAMARGIPRLIFLLDENTAWPPGQMDGFTGDGDHGARIRELRDALARDLLASYFSTPDELAQKVSVATSQQLAARPAGADKHVADDRRAAPFNVPLDISDLVDRSEVLGELAALFDAVPHAEAPVVVSLYGPGGVGKSTLAVRLVHRLRERFPDGVLYASLAEGSPEGMQASSTLTLFLFLLGKSVESASEIRLVSEFRTTIADMRVLIVLDGITHANQARPLLPVSGGSGAILTSRSPLASLEGAELISVPVLSDQDSVRLLAQLAKITLDASNIDEAVDLARMCGHLPLAIRVAGAKLRTRADWDLGTLVEKMIDETSRLDFLQIGDLEVRATLLTSYEDRDPGEQRALRALAITEGNEFPGWALAPMLQISVAESERLIERLVFGQLVLVSRVDGTRQTLYRLHDLVRELARELLEQVESVPERTAMSLRLSIQYLELVEGAASALRQLGSGQLGAVRPIAGPGPADLRRVQALIAQHPTQWFADHREGIIASLRRIAASAASADEAQLIDRFARSMLDLLILTPFSQDRVHVHQLVVEASRAAADQARLAAALRDLARAYRDFGRYPESTPAFEEAIAIFELLHDEENLAATRQLYAVLLLQVGRMAEARETTLGCLAHFDTAGDTAWQAYAYRTLGIIYRNQAKWAEATSAFERALDLFRRVGDRHREATCVVQYGAAIRMQGDPELARSMYAQPAAIFSALGFPLWGAITQVYRAASLVDLGNDDDARALLAESLSTFAAIGDLRWVDIAQYHQGRLELRTGNSDRALQLLEQSARRIGELGEPYSEAHVLLALGEAQLAQDQAQAAGQTFRRALTKATLIGNTMLEQTVRRTLESMA